MYKRRLHYRDYWMGILLLFLAWLKHVACSYGSECVWEEQMRSFALEKAQQLTSTIRQIEKDVDLPARREREIWFPFQRSSFSEELISFQGNRFHRATILFPRVFLPLKTYHSICLHDDCGKKWLLESRYEDAMYLYTIDVEHDKIYCRTGEHHMPIDLLNKPFIEQSIDYQGLLKEFNRSMLLIDDLIHQLVC